MELEQVNSQNANDCCSINSFMIPAKLSYFFTVSRRGIDTYFILFFMSLGFNAAEAGILGGLQYIGGIIGAAGWSYVADKYRKHKLLVVLLGTMAIITTSILPILGIPFGDKQRFKCSISINETIGTNNNFHTSKNHNILYLSILFLAMIGKSFDASVASFINKMVFTYYDVM